MKYGKNEMERRRRRLSAIFVILMAATIPMVSSRWSEESIAADVFFISGILLANIGCLGRLWSSLFISGYKSRELIVSGPYSMCRNPLYFFSAIGLIGIGLTTCTFAIPLVMACCFAIYYRLIISQEEQRLKDVHGAAFEEYCRQTPAFWPSARLLTEPESYEIRLKAIRRSFADGFWFVAIAAVVHLMVDLHARQWLPHLVSSW